MKEYGATNIFETIKNNLSGKWANLIMRDINELYICKGLYEKQCIGDTEHIIDIVVNVIDKYNKSTHSR